MSYFQNKYEGLVYILYALLRLDLSILSETKGPNLENVQNGCSMLYASLFVTNVVA